MHENNRYKKIAIMGGTFDPIHNGHLAAASAARYALEADAVYFIPAGNPPHKEGQETADAAHRLEMTRLAIKDCEYFKLLDLEIRRGGKSYTADTMREIKAAHNPGTKIFFIIGSDSLPYLRQWNNSRELFSLTSFAVVLRPGCDDAELSGEISALRRDYGAKISVLQSSGVQISSSELRKMIKTGKPVTFLLPREVEDYIMRESLYSDYAEVKRLIAEKYGETDKKLRTMLSAKRYTHTVGTAYSAVRLAEKHGCDPDKALLAALVHDCAKCFTSAELFDYCNSRGLEAGLDPQRDAYKLHSIAGADMAERQFDISDPDILGAVRCHTTGRRGMTLLDKIIYAADSIDPSRGDYPPRAELEKAAFENLDRALYLCMKSKINYTLSKGKPVSEESMSLLEYFRSLI